MARDAPVQRRARRSRVAIRWTRRGWKRASGGASKLWDSPGSALDLVASRYEWAGGAAHGPTVAFLASGADPLATVHARNGAAAQSRASRRGALRSVPFFVVADEASFHLGLAYDHFVAGGDSIVLLLQDLVEDYCGVERSDPAGAAARPVSSQVPALVRAPGDSCWSRGWRA